MNFIFRYFKNRKLRKRYREVRSVVRETLAADDDILSEKEKNLYNDLARDVRAADPTDETAVADLEAKLDNISYHHSFSMTMRGFLDVLAVALAVAFGIRGLFLQPFKIPTSSMQPTLFGIHFIDRIESADNMGFLTKFFLPLSASTATVSSSRGGEYREGSLPFSRSVPSALITIFTPLNCYLDASKILIGREQHVLPGHDVRNTIYRYLDQSPEKMEIAPGTTVFDGYLGTGDHLFVDRLSLHFYPLQRGEIFIFNTENLHTANGLPLPGYYYVKRIAGIPGDTLKIVDNILYIKPEGATEFRRADELSPRMKKLYSFRGGYQGHAPLGLLADGREFQVPRDSYFAMGDNTNNSLDSRMWNVVPHRNIIGRALMVFWPVSRRWGWIDNLDPLPCDTVFPEKSTQPTAMRRQ